MAVLHSRCSHHQDQEVLGIHQGCTIVRPNSSSLCLTIVSIGYMHHCTIADTQLPHALLPLYNLFSVFSAIQLLMRAWLIVWF